MSLTWLYEGIYRGKCDTVVNALQINTRCFITLFFLQHLPATHLQLAFSYWELHLQSFEWMWDCRHFEAFQETPAQTDNSHACCTPHPRSAFIPIILRASWDASIFLSDPIAASVSSLWEWSCNFSHPLKKTVDLAIQPQHSASNGSTCTCCSATPFTTLGFWLPPQQKLGEAGRRGKKGDEATQNGCEEMEIKRQQEWCQLEKQAQPTCVYI